MNNNNNNNNNNDNKNINNNTININNNNINHLQDVNIITAPAYELGRGTFGVVYKAKWLGANVAVKYLHSHLCSQQPDRVWKKIVRDFENEYNFLSKLGHPNIVQYFGLTKHNDAVGIVTELTWGSLFKRNHMKPRLTIRQIVDCSIQLGAGLRYLHEQQPPIIHRDFASKNVLLGFDGQAKIADLGVATLVTPLASHMTRSPGTEPYIAPECRIKNTYTEKIDIFSYAVTILELCTGQVPKPKTMFTQYEDPNTGIRNINQVPEFKRREQELNSLTNAHCLITIILQGIKDCPETRPTAHQMLTMLNKVKSLPEYTTCRKEPMLEGIINLREKSLEQQMTKKESEVLQLTHALEQARKELLSLRNMTIGQYQPMNSLQEENLNARQNSLEIQKLSINPKINIQNENLISVGNENMKRFQRPTNLALHKNGLIMKKKHNDPAITNREPYPKISPNQRMDLSRQNSWNNSNSQIKQFSQAPQQIAILQQLPQFNNISGLTTTTTTTGQRTFINPAQQFIYIQGNQAFQLPNNVKLCIASPTIAGGFAYEQTKQSNFSPMQSNATSTDNTFTRAHSF